MKTQVIKIAILYVFLGFISTSALHSQNCNYYYFKSGKTITMGFFNKKGKAEGKVIYQVEKVSQSNGASSATIKSSVYDSKSKELNKATSNMQCKGGELMIDMSVMIAQSPQLQSANVEGSGFFLNYPSSLKTGQTLEDGAMNMDIEMGKGLKSSVSIRITNRVVAAKESVTTPAGSWDAYKITYDSKTVINMGIPIPIQQSCTEWFVPGFGVVKTQFKSGKTELLSIE